MHELIGNIELIQGEITFDLFNDIQPLEGDLLVAEPILEGEISVIGGMLSGDLVSETQVLVGEIIQAENAGLAIIGDLFVAPSGASELPAFMGSYEVTSLADTDQILETAGKQMLDDLVVLAIPYSETSNSAGGMTVTIG